jgi:DNA-binding CsgD family transcriptional regulator
MAARPLPHILPVPPTRAGAPEPSSAVLRVLTDFRLAFATFDRAARCVDLSHEALGIFGPDFSRADRLCATLLTGLLDDEGDRGPWSRQRGIALHPNGRYELRAELLPPGDESRAAVVLALPCADAPARSDLGALGLTTRENDVARLLVCGRSARTVASSLGISVHTARRHTEKLYTKLGVSSRAELAALVTRQR